MATGLVTFDAFSWASLLKGRQVLVIDRSGPHGQMLAEAAEEAGAIATRAPNQIIAADRLVETVYRHVILSLSPGEALAARLVPGLMPLGRSVVVLADPAGHAELRAALPAARLADLSMDARSLVLFLVETLDE